MTSGPPQERPETPPDIVAASTEESPPEHPDASHDALRAIRGDDDRDDCLMALTSFDTFVQS